MTPQDCDDIIILKHAAQDIVRELWWLLKESAIDELDHVDIVEKGRALARIGEIIGAIIDNGKHLPYGEEEE